MRPANPPQAIPSRSSTKATKSKRKTRERKHTETWAPHTVFLPPTPPVRSRRAATIVRWFGLDDAMRRPVESPRTSITLDIAPGTITLVTGPSGAGKSSFLRDVRRDAHAASEVRDITWIDLADIALPQIPIVDCLRSTDDDPRTPGVFAPSVPVDTRDPDPDASLRAALLDLARVGLAEAWTYLRTPAELSDGQRWRLRLALALDAARRATRNNPATRIILVADEFAALLDRVTAAVIARSLRRIIGAPGSTLAAIVATSHHDLTPALRPDVTVHCDFGRIWIAKTSTIPAGPAARGFADQRAPEASARPPSAPLDSRSRQRNTDSGGPMRKILVTTIALLALTPILRADDPPTRAPVDPGPRGGNDRLLSEPRGPFEPPRSLFEFDPRPSRGPAMPLYPTVERELDRGTGRIESDVTLEMRRVQVEQDARRNQLPRQSESERFQEDYDRTLRLDQRQRRAERDAAAQQRVETESQRLAAERERFYRSAGIDTTGAAADSTELKRLERQYQRDVKQLRKKRDAELKRLAKEDLTDDTRRMARDEITERYRAAQAERRERHAADRARVLGNQ